MEMYACVCVCVCACWCVCLVPVIAWTFLVCHQPILKCYNAPSLAEPREVCVCVCVCVCVVSPHSHGRVCVYGWSHSVKLLITHPQWREMGEVFTGGSCSVLLLCVVSG